MNVAAIALDEKNKAVVPQRTLQTSSIRPNFRASVEPKLAPAIQKPAPYSVKRGDNLWKITRSFLDQQGEKVSKNQVYQAVQRVARANSLRNPDLIRVGQSLDLTSALDGLRPAPQAAGPVLADAKPAAPLAGPASATSAIKTFNAQAAAPATVVAAAEPKPSDTPKTGIASAGHAVGAGNAALLAATEHALAAKAASAAFGGPNMRVLGETPPLVPAGSVETSAIAKLPGSSEAPASDSKRPNIQSLMEKIGFGGNKEARIGLGSPWRKIIDGASRITSGFGTRSDPFTGRLQHHSGLDIAAKHGTRIFPMEDGRVIYSGWKGGYGRTVVIEHDNGLESTYGHNSKNLVKVGDRVTADMPIGLVGSTGRSTGPHIHFEVRENGRAVDPVPLLEERSIKISETL
jgi:murein DD-endopeptidase MepM/ murein hydrolase activator NlpD